MLIGVSKPETLRCGFDRRGTPARRVGAGFRFLSIAALRPLALALALLLVLCAKASAQSMVATIDPPTVEPGESSTLAVDFVNCQPKNIPAVPGVAGLKIVYRGESTQVRSFNGNQTIVYGYTFDLQADKPGTYTIPSIAGQSGSTRMATQPVKLVVTKRGTGDGANRQAFLRLVSPRTEYYIGEPVQVDILLYVTQGRNYSLSQLVGEGFVFGKNAQMQPGQEVVDGVAYQRVGQRIIAVPSKTGNLSLGPAECDLVLLIRSRQRRADDFPDPFDMFGRVEERRVHLQSDPLALHIIDPPAEGRPSFFTGAVGQFTMQVTVSPTNVALGEPITIKINLPGRGGLEAFSAPPLNVNRGFKSYPPTARLDTTDALGLEGVRTFEQVITPTSEDIKEVPGIQFAYFDPQKKAYQTLSSASVPIVVRPSGNATALAPQPAQGQPETPATPATPELLPIKLQPGPLAIFAPPLLGRPGFLLAQTIPALFLLLSWMAQRRKERFAADPRKRRAKEADKFVRKGLKDLDRLANEGESEQFFTLAFRLVQERLGERLDLPAAGITEDVIDSHLRPKGTPEPVIEGLHQVFRACNQARYAAAGRLGSLTEWLPKVRQTLSELEGLR